MSVYVFWLWPGWFEEFLSLHRLMSVCSFRLARAVPLVDSSDFWQLAHNGVLLSVVSWGAHWQLSRLWGLNRALRGVPPHFHLRWRRWAPCTTWPFVIRGRRVVLITTSIDPRSIHMTLFRLRSSQKSLCTLSMSYLEYALIRVKIGVLLYKCSHRKHYPKICTKILIKRKLRAYHF